MHLANAIFEWIDPTYNRAAATQLLAIYRRSTTNDITPISPLRRDQHTKSSGKPGQAPAIESSDDAPYCSSTTAATPNVWRMPIGTGEIGDCARTSTISLSPLIVVGDGWVSRPSMN
jgi:hypothetical protein